MAGKLYLVGTPIGNLGDISPRARETLAVVDFIAAEDTRVTRPLLTHFDIHTRLISFHEHSADAVAESLCARLESGESGALVTDAGMPCISDPGAVLVALCYERDLPMEVVPGPSALIAALSLSGQDTRRFTFEGFLPVVAKERSATLSALKNETRTMVFYEAPHKLLRTLQDFAATFGGTRSITLCRELTKIHETAVRLTIGEAIAMLEKTPPRGEYVLVVAGAPNVEEETMTLSEAVALAQKAVNAGKRASDACREVAELTRYSKREIYAALMKNTI